MQNQTEMAFADGGLPVDPVSGNEVPPGSLPEEVRDDIKVGVSEGEYIVPADVLRYYGMKFFEGLRAEAKVALGGMEQEGRMGGEPMMEAPMEEEDDLPFSTEDLQATDDMNEGGYMRGYAKGGIGVSQKTGFDYSAGTQMADLFGTGSNDGSTGGSIGGIQYVTYYGPNGEIITIQTFNGSPMTPIPAGYTTTPPVAAAAENVAPPTAPPTSSSNDNDNDSTPNDTSPKPRKSVNEMTDKEVISELGSIGGIGDKFGIGLATVLGSLINPFAGAKAGSMAKKAVLDRNWEITKRATDIRSGMSNPAQQATFDKELANALRSVGDRTRSKEEKGILGKFFDNITGKSKIEQVEGGAGLIGATNTVRPLTPAEQAARNQYLTTRQTTPATDKQVVEGAVSTRDFVKSTTGGDSSTRPSANIVAKRNESDAGTKNSVANVQATLKAKEKAENTPAKKNAAKAAVNERNKANTVKAGTTTTKSAKASVDKMKASGKKMNVGGRAKGGLMTKK